MNTIDQFLRTVINRPINIVPDQVQKALHGLVATMDKHVFLTEGQAQFCISLLSENVDVLKRVEPEIINLLKNPAWSKPFRKIVIVKKLYIVDRSYIKIESNFSKPFRQLMARLGGTNIKLNVEILGKDYRALLTERNIKILVDELSPLGFDISDEIMAYYNTIESWNAREVSEQFVVDNYQPENKQKIIDDIGDLSNSLLVADRRLRYQYHIANNYLEPSDNLTLSELLATRIRPHIWVDSTKYSFRNLIESLHELKRLPSLLVFRDKLSPVFELPDISKDFDINNIGIYFRLSNSDETGKVLNDFISENNYNKRMDQSLQIAGIMSNNLPKFFLTENWEPMSVISINHCLSGSKSAIYADRCDLNITYTKDEPIFKNW